MIDIYVLYRKATNPRPFNRFFESAGFGKAYDYLKTQELPEAFIIKRSRGSVAAPATAFVHPLIALEFIRWLNYSVYVEQLADLLTPMSEPEQP